MLGRGVAKELASGDPADVWAPEVRELAGSCDAVICNLECCVSERGSPTERIPGKPFFFRGPPQAVDALLAIGTTAVSLANNHALDYGPDALEETLSHLRTAGIPAAGAGPDIGSARRGVVVEAGGARVGVVAASDHPVEFAADADRLGIAHADFRSGTPAWLPKEIAGLREMCDLVVAVIHWGPNMTRRPAPWQLRVATELVDAGANVVAGHSAHVFHGIGWGERGPLLYDLGDALDDYAVDAELRNDLGVMAIWRPRSDPELELVGLRLDYCFTRLAEGVDADWIAQRLDRACSELGTSVERAAEQRFLVHAS